MPSPTRPLPHRGDGSDRPVDLAHLPLLSRGRPLKRWRYVGFFSERLMLCAGVVRIGPIPQSFWAVWDRERGVLRERTTNLGRPVRLPDGALRVAARGVSAELELDLAAVAPVETTSPHGAAWIWTRKRGGVAARGRVVVDGEAITVEGRACTDESAGHHARDTAWSWSAGVGVATDGPAVAWNLVEGVHDAEAASERTVWVDGEPREVGPVTFAADLSSVGGLRFSAEAVRERHERLGPFASEYRQPFGSFSGPLPEVGMELRDGLGVMERHRARW